MKAAEKAAWAVGGLGFVAYTALKVLSGKGDRVHWMMYLASVAFVVYFTVPLIERGLG